MDIISDSAKMRVAFVIIGTLVFFYLYYYIAHSGVFKKIVQKNSSEVKGELQLFLFRKLTGIIFLGILPAIVYAGVLKGSFKKFGIALNHLANNIIVILILILIIATLLYLSHKKNPQQSTLQIKTDRWTVWLFLYNILGWTFYLFAYEFLFRGILLFECFDGFGFWPAMAINISLYSAVHMVNGKGQALGALIFGFVACWFTLTRGTVLIPWIMHITLSGFSDYFSIKMNQEIGFVKTIPAKYEKL